MAFGLATEDDDGEALTKNKVQQQPTKKYEDYNAAISDERAKAFQEWCNSNGINDDILYPTLENFGYTFISDIKNKDLKKITVELEKLVKGET